MDTEKTEVLHVRVGKAELKGLREFCDEAGFRLGFFLIKAAEEKVLRLKQGGWKPKDPHIEINKPHGTLLPVERPVMDLAIVKGEFSQE